MLERIVVTPNRNPAQESTVGSAVTKITKEEIDAQSLPLAIDYLAQVPGVAISSPGGPGAEGSLSIRGAARRYIKTLYNGIDIADMTSPQVQTTYQHLLGGNIDSIEVLRGSQSTLYGSDAIAGVISISTFGEIDSGIRHVAFVEGGSLTSGQGGYGLRAANEQSKLSLNVIGFRTDGISAAAIGSERDGYENITGDFNVEHSFSESFSVFASGVYIDGKADFDDDGYLDFASGDFVPPSDNLTARNESDMKAARFGFNIDLADGRFRNTVSFQGFDITREISGTFFDGIYTGNRRKADYHGTFEASDWLMVQGGGDYETQEATFPESVFNPEINSDFSLGGVWAEAVMNPVEPLTLTAGLRYDEHSEFGGFTTYRATGSYLFEGTGTRLHSSMGTGFRAPSLNELFGPFGANPFLEPETSLSFDAGVEQTFLDGAATTDVTWFLLDIDDLIQYTNRYEQVPGKSRQRGIEASLSYGAADWLDVNGAYTYTQSENASGERNIRIPRHQIGLTATARPWDKWMISAAARIALDTVDQNDFELDDYVLVDAKVGYKPTGATELYMRVENLLDQDYQTVRGFGTPGFSAFAGFKAEF